MPVFFAVALRYVLIAAIQIGAFEAARIFLEKAFSAITSLLTDDEGMTKEDAEESIAAEILAMILALGANALLIKSRLPLRWVDKVAKVRKPPTLTATGVLHSQAPATATKVPWYKAKALKTLGIVAASSAVAKLFWIDSTIQNFLDQGTFNPTGANRALQALGLGGFFQWPTAPKELQPGTYTTTEFVELFNQLTAAGAAGINNEFEMQSQVWNKENLSQLVNAIVGSLILQGKKSDKAAVRNELSKYIVSRGGVVAPATAQAAAQPSFIAAPRVFTGIISQGTLGAGVSFTPRPDDLISNGDELQAAAQNNLAPFLASLAGRVVYEIKIVASITTKDGFTQRGTAQQIVSGYTKEGKPKYRTVVNKFAVLNLFILTERGTRTKITQIVLGPTDALQFRPEQTTLSALESTLQQTITTSNPAEIATIAQAPATASTIRKEYEAVRDIVFGASWTPSPDDVPALVDIKANYKRRKALSPRPLTEAEENTVFAQASTLLDALDRLIKMQQEIELDKRAPEMLTAPKLGLDAKTLSEWYGANSRALPTVSARSLIYADLGLGQASYYTGTAEQNTKLLAALKAQ